MLRPGGALAIVDLDGAASPYGPWLRADEPRYDPAAVERFFADNGFSLTRVLAEWPFPTGWEDWASDRPWPVPELPAEWSAA